MISAELGVREDLSEHFEPGQILDAVETANPNEKRTRIRSMSTQLNALVNEMTPGDLVLCSLPCGAQVRVGMLEPDLLEDPDGRPARGLPAGCAGSATRSRRRRSCRTSEPPRGLTSRSRR